MKQFKITDIYNGSRPLSWSAISSFEWSKEQWYDTYILGIRQESKEMSFGNYVDKKLQEDPLFLPEVDRYPVMQHRMSVVFNKVPLIGYADGYDPGKIIADYKTGKKAWNQKRADETGQLTCYAFLTYLIEKIPPSELTLRIVWLPTAEHGDFSIGFRDSPVVPYVFETKRTMLDILQFGQRISRRLKEMEAYVINRQALDAEPAVKV